MVFERTKIYEEAELPMIVIYENPTDFPGKFVGQAVGYDLADGSACRERHL